MNYQIELRVPSVKEYQLLRSSTDWDPLDDEVVATALQNTLFSVCAVEHSIIGSGRIIGDGAAYFYIQDMIVLPEFRGKGVGRSMMEALENWLSTHASKNTFVGLMAAEGAKEFYLKFGYRERNDSKPGMFKIIKV